MSILVGLTGWGDHASLYQNAKDRQNKLYTYSSQFPVVEIDSSFYAIQSKENYQKWVNETPENFSFVIKAFQTLTGHDRKSLTNREAKQIVDDFIESITPVIRANKLNTVLFQFPPWFSVKQRNLQKIKKIKHWMGDIPVAIEFRNRTWFEGYQNETLSLLKELGVTHVICDEPQAGEGSVPIVEDSTNDHVLIRFHGRNVHGWNNHGQENWREVRFLYCYNQNELQEWAHRIQTLTKKAKSVTVLFNNNSGGDAADNAKQLLELLDIDYKGLNPKQIDLFDF
ncbi:DUF72 domain-containing protein [Gracilibacillus kekensis]|uniref:Uncharacterized conserved protein YecE, DUF72 family n=1 Tax=Gracilibacillus kekensis TaxID=1027249 RepID=A0A1M7PNW3_9BACI|nr:DUF72 domain-containing protein [Gracilibacillus kekensis]SHN18979.1 Uncharacterized conserved protein YecE, DUF72 family [Gracilibacillus kekensis]